MKNHNTIMSILVLLVVAGCSSDSDTPSTTGNASDVQVPVNEENIIEETALEQAASEVPLAARTTVNNGFFLKTVEEYGSDGSLFKSVRYDIDYAENTLTAIDLLIDSQPVEHIFEYGQAGDLSKATYFITDEASLSEQDLLQIEYIRDTEGRLQEARLEYHYGVESDWTTVFNYSVDGRLEGYLTTFASNFELGEGDFTSDVETGEYQYDAENQLVSLQVTDRELPGVVFDTAFIINDGVVLSAKTTATSSSFAFNETALYRYDSLGNIASIEYVDESGGLIRSDVFTYAVASEPVFNLIQEKLYYFQ